MNEFTGSSFCDRRGKICVMRFLGDRGLRRLNRHAEISSLAIGKTVESVRNAPPRSSYLLMKFLLIISHDEQFVPTPELLRDITAWVRNQTRRRVRLDGHPLKPADEAVTVRIRNGHLRQQPGPFTRSKEKMCAYELVEAPDLEAAAALAASHPMAQAATIEVRPVWEDLE
jgi:hypothetical protein